MKISKRFTEREKEVATLLLQGKSNKQIALLLNISRSTVEFHLKNVYIKLNVNSRTEAVLQLSEDNLRKSIAQEQNESLWQSIGDKSAQAEYSSQAKHFFDPKEEIAMKNRTKISIILSIIAILVAVGAFVYLQFEKVNNDSSTPNNEQTVPVNTPRGVLQVPLEASTRSYDEVLLLLQTPNVPFHYEVVFVAVDCFMPGGQNCSFTGRISVSDEEPMLGEVAWMPDGENGFYASGNEILVLNHLERKNAKSAVFVSDIPLTESNLHLSPDTRWMVQSIEVGDPYASDLVLIKTSSGRVVKLDIGLEECFKTPLGWMTPSKFLFRCDISTGPTPKKLVTEVCYYTYDVLSDELLEIASGMDLGFDAISPNGKYAIYYKKQNGFRVKDLLNGQIYPSTLPNGQKVWSHDSSKIAIFTDTGDIYTSNYDGSNQKKIYSSGEPGYLSMEWFPDDKYVALVGYFNGNEDKTQMIVMSTNGDVIQYDSIPTTDGYNIIGISPLPDINK